MFSFRQKIFFTYVFVILVFIGLIFLFAQDTVKDIAKKAMYDRASEIIARIDQAPNDEALVQSLKESKPLIFFRISVISNEHKILYDSHVKRVLGPDFNPDYIVNHPEVTQAFRTGTGYHEEYSDILTQDFAYFAKSFNFHGKTYVLRTAFPLQYVQELTQDFEVGFLGSAIIILILFSTMTWFIINYLTRPIRKIISAVAPYQEGLTTTVPIIHMRSGNRSDEFSQLANTLNSLSIKIRSQIESVTIERNEKEAVLESLVEGVIAVNNNNKIVFANAMALKILGTTTDKIINQSVDILPQEKCSLLLRKCQLDKSLQNDTMELSVNGDWSYIDLVAAPKKDGTGAILVMQDKTEHYKIIEMRKEFIANASHELKTPITIIRGFTETLHDNPNLSPEVYTDITNKIVRNCHKMTILIKDLLILSDIEHIPESRLLECDLVELAKESNNTVLDAYPDATITLDVPDGEEFILNADPNLIELAFTNLIENGVKYSDPPANIIVRMVHEAEQIRIDIIDHGCGIPKKELTKIFRRFYRVDQSRAKKIDGSGLGLSIVETIVDKHFGTIDITSEIGKGTTFTLRFPINV